ARRPRRRGRCTGAGLVAARAVAPGGNPARRPAGGAQRRRAQPRQRRPATGTDPRPRRAGTGRSRRVPRRAEPGACVAATVVARFTGAARGSGGTGIAARGTAAPAGAGTGRQPAPAARHARRRSRCMKPYRSLVIALLAAVAGVVIAQWLAAQDPATLGRVMVRGGGMDYSTTLPAATLLLLVGVLLLALAWQVVRLPFRTWGRYRMHQSRARLLDGLRALYRGQWARS